MKVGVDKYRRINNYSVTSRYSFTLRVSCLLIVIIPLLSPILAFRLACRMQVNNTTIFKGFPYYRYLSSAFMLDTYGHLIPGTDESAATSFDQLILPGITGSENVVKGGMLSVSRTGVEPVTR